MHLLQFHRFRILLFVAGLFALAACTSTMPEDKTVPDMSFSNIERLPVKVAYLNVENHFDPSSDPQDVSSSFPSAPDIALRRYAESKIQPSGTDGTLKFIIEDAHIHHKVEQPENKFINWTKLDRRDVYDVSLRIRLFAEYNTGAESDHAVLNLHRTISIPQSFSLDEKEQEKFGFLELLMDDVDKAVTDALRYKIDIAGIQKEVPIAALLEVPETLREY